MEFRRPSSVGTVPRPLVEIGLIILANELIELIISTHIILYLKFCSIKLI